MQNRRSTNWSYKPINYTIQYFKFYVNPAPNKTKLSCRFGLTASARHSFTAIVALPPPHPAALLDNLARSNIQCFQFGVKPPDEKDLRGLETPGGLNHKRLEVKRPGFQSTWRLTLYCGEPALQLRECPPGQTATRYGPTARR